MPLPLTSQEVPAAAACLRWVTETRYYTCTVHKDLFGNWEIWRTWGAKGSRRGGDMKISVPSKEEAMLGLDDVARARSRRGYVLTR